MVRFWSATQGTCSPSKVITRLASRRTASPPSALGALFATQGQDDPRERVLTALRAAERFNAGVRGPFHVLSESQSPPAKPLPEAT